MSNMYYGEDDLVMNTASRVPVCLCLDVSGSMYDCIGELNEGVNLFYDAIRKDEQASMSCEIAIVTFGSYVNVVEQYSTIDHKQPIHLTANGGTDMTGGVQKALQILEERKQEYKRNGVDYYQPWLVVMSDGAPNDISSLRVEQAKIREMEANKKITVFPIGIGDDADMQVLNDFSGKRKAIRLKDNNFAGFFEFLGKSMSSVSASQLGQTVKLDTSNFADWAEI